VSFLREEDETLTSDPKKVDCILYNYYFHLFQSNSLQEDWEIPLEWQPYYEPLPTVPHDSSSLTSKISMTEIWTILSRSQIDSSPGPDQISWAILINIPKEHSFWVSLLEELNSSFVTGNIPTEWNKGKTILLTKVEPFNGDPNKLRPICLINTIRKIFTGIIDNRLKDYLEKYQLLLGTNFGFQRGMSTSNSIFTIKSIIDIAEREKAPLILTLLDIRKAYDTVPGAALQHGLRRLGIPNLLIALIKSINQDLQIQVQHSYGLTEPFYQSNGLPQGDKYSPTLWLILYDPLLTRIAAETVGYTLPNNMSVTHLAFADDLKVLSNTQEDSQKQLNITSSFLNFHKMKANPDKTVVAINRHVLPKQLCLYLQGHKLNYITPPNELVRFLGVFLTLDSNNAKTIAHAMKYFHLALHQLYNHYCPGPLATYIVNMVIIPVLQYRLQVTFVYPTKLAQIDSKIRSLIRRKYCLPPHTSTSLLYSSTGNIKLFNLESTLNRNLITNSMVHIKSSTITAEVFRFSIDYFTRWSKLPQSLAVCPIAWTQLKQNLPIKKRMPFKVPLTFHLSNSLYQSGLQLRTMAEHLSSNIFKLLSIKDYSLDYTHWQKAKIHCLEDISDLPKQNILKDYFSDFQSGSTWTNRFIRGNYFVGNLTFQSFLSRAFPRMDFLLPENEALLNQWGLRFQRLMDGIHQRLIQPHSHLEYSDSPSMIDCHANNLEFDGTIPLLNNVSPLSDFFPSAPLRSIINKSIVPDSQFDKLTVYTDGSLIPKQSHFPLIGTSHIYVHEYASNWDEYGRPLVSKHSHHLPFMAISNSSSTTAEALAIQQAVLHAPKNFKLDLFTDSTSAISSQTQVLKHSQSLTSRQRLKIPNLLLYEVTAHSLKQNKQSLFLTHVKAHTNQHGEHFKYNNIADTLAKQAANPMDKEQSLNSIYYRQYNPYIPQEIAANYLHTQVFHNGIIAMVYPRTILKHHFITKYNDLLISQIQAAFHSLYPHLPPLSAESTKQAMTLASNLSKMSHFLDARNVHEEKFRRNLLLNQIPTLVLIKSWNLKSRFPTSSNCVMCSCNTPEDFHHLWTCANISTQMDKMIPAILKIMKERYNIPANTPVLRLLINRLNLANHSSLPAITKLFFFTEQEINPLQTFLKESYRGNMADISNLIFQLLDSYLSTFYELIWKPRCRTIHSGKDPPSIDMELLSPGTTSLPPGSQKRPRSQEETPGSTKRYNLRFRNLKSASTNSTHSSDSDSELQRPYLHSTLKRKRKVGIYFSEDSDYSSISPSKASGNNTAINANISPTTIIYQSLNKRARLSIPPPQYTRNYWNLADNGG
jgi:hypothetical protein